MNNSLDLSWFDLDNYSRFENMSIREWASEICNREYLNNEIVNGNIDNNPKSIQKCINYLSGIYNDDEKIEGEVVAHLNLRFSKEIAKKPEKTASIRPLIFFDIWQIRYFYKDVLKKYWIACKKIQQLSRNKEDDIAFNYIDDALGERNFKLLGIDLSASDEQLKCDFSSWLDYERNKKSEKPPKKTFTQKHFDVWVKYMCVPYIDLFLISKIQNKKIPYHSIANLLFPNEFDVGITERVRKVTHQKAMWLLNNNISRALHLQADYEQSKNMAE